MHDVSIYAHMVQILFSLNGWCCSPRSEVRRLPEIADSIFWLADISSVMPSSPLSLALTAMVMGILS